MKPVKGVSFNQQSKDIAHIKRYNAGEGLLNFRLRLGEYDPWAGSDLYVATPAETSSFTCSFKGPSTPLTTSKGILEDLF